MNETAIEAFNIAKNQTALLLYTIIKVCWLHLHHPDIIMFAVQRSRSDDINDFVAQGQVAWAFATSICGRR